KDGLARAHADTARWMVLAVACPATALALFAQELLLLFGQEFPSGSTALIFLLAGQLVPAIAGPSGQLLLMTGHQRRLVPAALAGLIAGGAACALLIPPFGGAGAALAFLTGTVVLHGLIVRAAFDIHRLLPWSQQM